MLSKENYEPNPFTKPENAAVWIQCVEAVQGEFRDAHIYPRLAAWEDALADGTVLEIGCGQGVCSPHVSRRHSYVGVEPSAPLVSRAKELYQTQDRTFQEGNAYALPIKDASCVAAFSVNVWMHLLKLELAGSELTRVICSEGHFLIISANPDAYDEWERMYFNFKRTSDQIAGGFHLPGIDMPEHIIFTHTMERLTGSLEDNGLEPTNIETFGRASESDNSDWFVAISGIKR